jgi:hypothetical protein
MGRIFFRVSFNMPEGATWKEAKDYVEAAMTSWHGAMGDLDNPTLESLKVTRAIRTVMSERKKKKK